MRGVLDQQIWYLENQLWIIAIEIIDGHIELEKSAGMEHLQSALMSSRQLVRPPPMPKTVTLASGEEIADDEEQDMELVNPMILREILESESILHFPCPAGIHLFQGLSQSAPKIPGSSPQMWPLRGMLKHPLRPHPLSTPTWEIPLIL
jgi:hypothetical protein